jgi:hypothetical protein
MAGDDQAWGWWKTAVTRPEGSGLLAALLVLTPGLGCATVVADSAPWQHTVRSGDTLIGVVQQWAKPGTDWRVLATVNRIRDPRRLQPGSTLLIPRELLLEEPMEMDVLHAHGDVQLERAGAAATALTSGMTVRTGDLVRTGRQSSASLRAPDGSRIMLREDSALQVLRHGKLGKSAIQETELRLDKGAADTQVAPAASGQARSRLQMRTPVVNLGVRGTEFRTRSQGDQSAVEVLSGQVGAAGGQAGEVPVQAGFGLVATPAGPGAPTALPPAPDIQGLPQKVERVPLSLQWQSAPAAGWRVQVHVLGRPGQVLLDGVFKQPSAQWADDLPDGRYGLRLRMLNEQGLEGRDGHFEFELKARPEPPFLSNPADRSRMADASQALSWTRQPAAATYRLQVADSPDFAQPRIDRSDIRDPGATVDAREGTQHWRVASVLANGDTGPWSEAQTFTRVARPTAPGVDAPQAQADGQLLRWRATPGMRYQLQVARDPGFAILLADTVLDQPQWLLPKPEPGTYHIRVRSISAEGFEGPFGSPQILEVPAPPAPLWPWLLPLLLLL